MKEKTKKIGISLFVALLIGLFLALFALSGAEYTGDMGKPLEVFGAKRKLKKNDIAILNVIKPSMTQNGLRFQISTKSTFATNQKVELTSTCSLNIDGRESQKLPLQIGRITHKKGNKRIRYTYSLLPHERTKIEEVKTQGGTISCTIGFGKSFSDSEVTNNEKTFELEWQGEQLKKKN